MAQKFLDMTGLQAVLAKVKTEINNAQAAASAPKATATSLGIVMPGSGITIDADGKMSVDTTAIATVESVNSKVTAEVNKVVGGAPETYDTLKEIADYIEDHKDVETTLNAAIGAKANSADVYAKTEADSTFVKGADLQALTAQEVTAACDSAFA